MKRGSSRLDVQTTVEFASCYGVNLAVFGCLLFAARVKGIAGSRPSHRA